jgi:hypothetical protein
MDYSVWEGRGNFPNPEPDYPSLDLPVAGKLVEFEKYYLIF